MVTSPVSFASFRKVQCPSLSSYPHTEVLVRKPDGLCRGLLGTMKKSRVCDEILAGCAPQGFRSLVLDGSLQV